MAPGWANLLSWTLCNRALSFKRKVKGSCTSSFNLQSASPVIITLNSHKQSCREVCYCAANKKHGEDTHLETTPGIPSHHRTRPSATLSMRAKNAKPLNLLPYFAASNSSRIKQLLTPCLRKLWLSFCSLGLVPASAESGLRMFRPNVVCSLAICTLTCADLTAKQAAMKDSVLYSCFFQDQVKLHWQSKHGEEQPGLSNLAMPLKPYENCRVSFAT